MNIPLNNEPSENSGFCEVSIEALNHHIEDGLNDVSEGNIKSGAEVYKSLKQNFLL